VEVGGKKPSKMDGSIHRTRAIRVGGRADAREKEEFAIEPYWVRRR